jgi:phage terminase small subunit
LASELKPAPIGNDRAVTHGAYARLRLSEAAGETAETFAELVPLQHPADLPMLEAFAFVFEQLRAAGKALEDATRRADRLRLSQDARGWTLATLRFAEAFGMTPKARAELGLDLVRAGALADRDLDLNRMTEGQRTKLAELLSIAEGK